MDNGYTRVSLPTLIGMLHEKRYTNPTIAKAIGVTPLQVYYYHTGKTKEPRAEVCMKLFSKFKVNGKHMLVDLYTDINDLEHHLSIS